MKKTILIIIALACLMPAIAEEHKEKKNKVNYHPEIHGTIRGKYEYQPESNTGRFQVRNVRVSVNGKVAPIVSYKAEIDLSDEGQIKMKEATAKLTPFKNFDFSIGMMRVPFTIDAHRSPHLQYFANRSFIAKKYANIRDVGASLGYKIECAVPITLQAGVFNGSGLTDQKDFWSNSINYSAKAQFQLFKGFNLVLSSMKTKPDAISINTYDVGATYKNGRWIVEAEYLYRHYAKDAFQDVNAFNSFVCYDQPLKKVFSKISFLSRFDYMQGTSDGKTFDETTGKLTLTDAQRKRITGGITLSIDKPFISDIRLNYEHYFYRAGVTPKVSEQSKLVAELVVRF